MNWKLLGACSALSLLMFADADAMGFGRRADKAAAAGLGHSAASVRAYGVAKAAKKTYLAENESVKHMSTKDFIDLTRGKNPGVAPTDSEALINEKTLQGKFDKLNGQREALDALLESEDKEIKEIEGKLNTLIEGKEFQSLDGEDVGVSIDSDGIILGDKIYSFGLLFRGLRGDGDPFVSCTDEGFDSRNARELWNRLCELRDDFKTKSAKMQDLEKELKNLETEKAMLALEAKVRKAKESGGEPSDSVYSEEDSEHTDGM